MPLLIHKGLIYDPNKATPVYSSPNRTRPKTLYVTKKRRLFFIHENAREQTIAPCTQDDAIDWLQRHHAPIKAYRDAGILEDA